jgi:hypothetical protein
LVLELAALLNPAGAGSPGEFNMNKPEVLKRRQQGTGVQRTLGPKNQQQGLAP